MKKVFFAYGRFVLGLSVALPLACSSSDSKPNPSADAAGSGGVTSGSSNGGMSKEGGSVGSVGGQAGATMVSHGGNGGAPPSVTCGAAGSGGASKCVLPPSVCVNETHIRSYTNGRCGPNNQCLFDEIVMECPHFKERWGCARGECYDTVFLH